MENNKTKALKDEQEIPELTTVHKIFCGSSNAVN